ncbi:MAG: hypothetical protein JO252_15170, partial [Planctomycetaceae bacterium]|nr:hypothetical protein [Planctomycetaceae bacterium]
APPDDFATEVLSPVPQWPDNRLLVPAEGTAYLDMLDAWQRDTVAKPRDAAGSGDARGSDIAPGSGNRAPATPSPTIPPAPPPSGTASPFGRGVNSGTDRGGMSPRRIPGASPATPTTPESGPPQTRAAKTDLGVRLAAFQETGLPMPATPPLPGERRTPQRPPGGRDVRVPPIGMDPNPSDLDTSAPVNPRPDLSPEQYRESEAVGAQMAGILVPGALEFNEAEAAGLPRDSRPYVVTLQQAFTLALINSRIYQYRLEQIYLTSLAVTLQRFAFMPQFYAGLSPLTGVALGGGPSLGGGFPPPVPVNSFNYQTIATGSPLSNLNIGTIAGVGKVFNDGARLLMGYANQVVFNFLGHNSRQPTVTSALPLTLMLPFLRGGGRAVTLEALTQAERNLVYEVRNFAKFRQEFLVANLVGGSFTTFGSAVPTLGYSSPGNIDPTTGFISVLQDLQVVENDRRNVTAFERMVEVYSELIQGESSGLTQLQLDQMASNLLSARQQLVSDRTTYRSDLDMFKIQLGLPPDVPLVLDRGLTRKFTETFDATDRWQRNPKRELSELPEIAKGLPVLEDVIIDGRSCLAVYKEGKYHEDDLEALLLAAERVALERRLDIMNARAQLYDAWRQIRVTANALLGYFNVTITNQFVTPSTTTNPFGFLEQAKSFSLVLNAELPLVRLAERNAFRTALINYQRQRRILMNAEDFLKYQLRQDIRNLHLQYLTYEINRKNFVLSIRQKDQAIEQIIAPPQGTAAQAAGNQAPLQTTNLITFQTRLLASETALATAWQLYEIARLTLYRDLGTMPIDEWEAFSELFPSEYRRDDHNAARGAGPAPAQSSPPHPAPAVGH